MATRRKHTGNVIPFRKRRRIRRFRSARLAVLVVLGVIVAIGHYSQQDGRPQNWWEYALDASVGDSSASNRPRALRGGHAKHSGGGAIGGRGGVSASSYGRVTRVRDGDTIEVDGRPIRIAALDCAEAGTFAGEAATRRMRALVAGERLRCSLTGRRSYDRWIGSCRLESGRDIASVMISEGLCRRWR